MEYNVGLLIVCCFCLVAAIIYGVSTIQHSNKYALYMMFLAIIAMILCFTQGCTKNRSAIEGHELPGHVSPTSGPLNKPLTITVLPHDGTVDLADFATFARLNTNPNYFPAFSKLWLKGCK